MTQELSRNVELSLRQVLEMDADEQNVMATIPIIQELVPTFKNAGTLAEVGLSALVYSLAKTKVVTEDGEVKAKWELTSLVKDKEGKWLPLAKVWADFCYVHLGLEPTMASAYKRIWEVFVVNLGYDLDDLRMAGIQKLWLATGITGRLYPEIDLPLMDTLFGSPDRCAGCGFEPEKTVEFCPSCGEKFEPMPPGTIAQTALRIKQLRGEPEEVSEGLKILADLQAVVQDGVVVSWTVTPQCWQGEDEGMISYVPPWQIPIVEDGAPSDEMGVRMSHVQAFYRWLRRHFG